MYYLYKSTTGSVVNIGPYVISAHTGMESELKIPELEAEVGKTLSVVVLGEEPKVEVAAYTEPTKATVEPVIAIVA